MRRVDIGTEPRPAGWLESFMGAGAVATEFAKSHGKKVAEVMMEGVLAVGENTPISEIAALFETVIAVPRRLSDKSEYCGHP